MGPLSLSTLTWFFILAIANQINCNPVRIGRTSLNYRWSSCTSKKWSLSSHGCGSGYSWCDEFVPCNSGSGEISSWRYKCCEVPNLVVPAHPTPGPSVSPPTVPWNANNQGSQESGIERAAQKYHWSRCTPENGFVLSTNCNTNSRCEVTPCKSGSAVFAKGNYNCCPLFGISLARSPKPGSAASACAVPWRKHRWSQLSGPRRPKLKNCPL